MTDRVMVPVEPTPEMLAAGRSVNTMAEYVWQAMIAAAPPSERWVSNGGDGGYPDLVMASDEAPALGVEAIVRLIDEHCWADDDAVLGKADAAQAILAAMGRAGE